MRFEEIVMKAKRGEGPLLKYARPIWRGIQRFRLPVIRPLAALLYAERTFRHRVFNLVLKTLYYEPLLRYRCDSVGPGLQLGGMPEIIGDGRIRLGTGVTVDTRNTWIVGFKVSTDAELVIGDQVFIGYQTAISVANRVEIGSHTLIAGNVQIFDNISHPLSPERRRRDEQFRLAETAPVIIGENVWIGNAVHVMKGVTIGDNSVVAAGSIVTKSVPPNTLVAGNPAVVKKELGE